MFSVRQIWIENEGMGTVPASAFLSVVCGVLISLTLSGRRLRPDPLARRAIRRGASQDFICLMPLAFPATNVWKLIIPDATLKL